MTQHNEPQSSAWNIETLLVHGDRQTPSGDNKGGNPTVRPIFASTTYVHESIEALIRHLLEKRRMEIQPMYMPVKGIRMQMPLR